MSFLVEYFGLGLAKGREDPAARAANFNERLDAAKAAQEDSRVYSDLDGARKDYRFGHLRMNPFYEQCNKMFPHRRYVRRNE